MQSDPRSWLWDIQAAAADIQSFVEGMDFAGYANSALVRSAVERKFEIIGEALSQLAKAHPEIAERIPELRQIIGFRNQLIHRYAQINHTTVWEAIEVSLPEMNGAVHALLAQLDSEPSGM